MDFTRRRNLLKEMMLVGEQEDLILSPYQVYAKSTNGLVYAIYSTCFQSVEEEDTFIKEGFGDEFVHVGYYQIYDENMCHNYKIVDGEMVETTQEEKDTEIAEIQPKTETDTEKIARLEHTIHELSDMLIMMSQQ